MGKTTKQFYNMYGKPSERRILIGLCKKYECKFEIDIKTMQACVSGDALNVADVKDAYDRIISMAYKKLAFAQADNKFAKIPLKTLTSEFMASFSAMAYSIITGEPFMFKSKTEAHRAGLKVGGLI